MWRPGPNALSQRGASHTDCQHYGRGIDCWSAYESCERDIDTGKVRFTARTRCGFRDMEFE